MWFRQNCCWPGSRAPHRLYPRQELSRSQTKKGWSPVRKFLEIWVQAPLAQRKRQSWKCLRYSKIQALLSEGVGGNIPCIQNSVGFQEIQGHEGWQET